MTYPGGYFTTIRKQPLLAGYEEITLQLGRSTRTFVMRILRYNLGAAIPKLMGAACLLRKKKSNYQEIWYY